MQPAILAVIPARGGSKGLPGKNIRQLRGVPLIGHIAAAAHKTRLAMDLVLSTDSLEIADIARSLGIAVPSMRPPELATDNASSADVAVHVLKEQEALKGKPYDLMVLLQPTCPFTKPSTIDAAVAAVSSGDYDFAGTVVEIVDEHPAYMLRQDAKGAFVPAFPELYGGSRRQCLPRMYFRAGNVYATRRDALLASGSLIQPRATYVPVDRLEAVNINDSFDWWLAEAVARASLEP